MLWSTCVRSVARGTAAGREVVEADLRSPRRRAARRRRPRRRARPRPPRRRAHRSRPVGRARRDHDTGPMGCRGRRRRQVLLTRAPATCDRAQRRRSLATSPTKSRARNRSKPPQAGVSPAASGVRIDAVDDPRRRPTSVATSSRASTVATASGAATTVPRRNAAVAVGSGRAGRGGASAGARSRSPTSMSSVPMPTIDWKAMWVRNLTGGRSARRTLQPRVWPRRGSRAMSEPIRGDVDRQPRTCVDQEATQTQRGGPRPARAEARTRRAWRAVSSDPEPEQVADEA